MDERRAEINPAFDDCPVACQYNQEEDAGRKQGNFCGRCEVRPLWEEFEEGCKDDLADFFKEEGGQGDAAKDYSFENLLRDVRRLQRLDEGLGPASYPPSCSELQARALDTFRRARRSLERGREWEEWRKLKEGANANG